MSFKKAKSEVLKALQSKAFRHEARSDGEKNLLATGVVTIEQALELIGITRGDQAKSSKHDFDAAITVWVFKPPGWYIKFYMHAGCWFISFHSSG